MKEKKIRIISFQNAHNYGAVLQAYGLQQYLYSLGYKDVKFINYNPKYLRQRYKPFLFNSPNNKHFSLQYQLKRLISYPFSVCSSIKRNHQFNHSIKKLLVQTDKVITDITDLSNEIADILICGSDQIWNTSLTGTFDPVFFAQGNYAHLGYAISYAPSTELSALTEDMAINLTKMLGGFKYISVREEPIMHILKKWTDRDISVCIDPTLLCGPDAFKRIASKRIVKDDYILIYAYDTKSCNINKIIESIPDYKKYKKHVILFSGGSIKSFFCYNNHGTLSVEDFLSYFLYASYVITTSFHGLAFSLLFEKNFNVLFVERKYVRCKALLTQLNLLSRFIEPHSNIVTWESLNYVEINKRIDGLRSLSIDYLNKAL